MPINASKLMLLGGVPCLDYVNTKNWHPEEAHYDFFTDYNALLRWSLQLDLITQPQAEQLYELARHHSQNANFVLEQAKSLSETTYKIFFAVANGLEVPANELKLFNGAWTSSLESMQVIPDHKAFRWKWVGTDKTLDSVLSPVVQSAAELLISPSEILRRLRMVVLGYNQRRSPAVVRYAYLRQPIKIQAALCTQEGKRKGIRLRLSQYSINAATDIFFTLQPSKRMPKTGRRLEP